MGVLWALAFVGLESVQFVYFGGLFQRMNSFQFGALVFGVTSVTFIAGSAAFDRPSLKAALAHPRLLLAINITATFAWAAFLTSVQLIEPAVAYTIGAGVMPFATLAFYRLGLGEGDGIRNRIEGAGNALILAGLLYLSIATIAGLSGFVRGGAGIGALGILFAIADGVFFVWLLILCQRLDRRGVAAGTVFGLRFPLYVLVAGSMAAAGIGAKAALPLGELILITLIGIALIVPPLYALQRAVALVSTLTLSTLTALGPFVIFALQMIEGRVAFSGPTLWGLAIYFAGAILAALGAMRAVQTGETARL